MAKLTDIVFDSFEPARLARFWADALDGYTVRAYDQTELQAFAARGLTTSTDPSVAVDGPGPTLFFQRSTQIKRDRNRVHLDTRAADRSSEVMRLESLGATVRDVHDSFTVMLDPEGNEFCVLDQR